MNGPPPTGTAVPVAATARGQRRRWWVLVVLAGAVSAATYLWLPVRPAAPDAASGAPAPPAVAAPAEAAGAGGASLTVSLVHPVPMLWTDELVASGAVTAWQEAVVSAEIGGARVAELLVDVGDQVRRGDLLARFDAASLEAAVAQQRAAVAEARARVAETSAAAQRARRLRETFAISEQDLIKSTTAADAAQAQLELAQARLVAQQLALDDTRVLAPDDGVVSSRTAMLGAVAAPGMEMFRLVRQNRLDWRAELTPAQLARVHAGAGAGVQLPDGTTVRGTVRQVAPVLDEKTRIGIAYVELAAGAAGVRPGMYVSGSIGLGERAGLALPASAVVVRDGREAVFVVDAEGRALETRIRVGRRRGSEVEVLEGVGTDAAVVASGGAFLNSGDRVRVVDAPAARRGGAA
jgi:RND family efflux transporter MFP subunit